jgi:hypothetical protein
VASEGSEQSTELSQEKSEQQKPFEPEIGQRVTLQPYEGESTLTGKVVEKDENSVTMQCGRVTIPALREKGTFAEAPEAERTATKEYAKEQAQNHVGENHCCQLIAFFIITRNNHNVQTTLEHLVQ